MNLTEPIRDKEEVRRLIYHYRKLGESRNYVLISLCVHTALRISDILRIKNEQVYDYKNKCVRKFITIKEQKTGKSKIIALNDGAVIALEYHFNNTASFTGTESSDITKFISTGHATTNPAAPLILNSRTGKSISRIQAYRLIRAAAEAVKTTCRASCHSLRKTFGYHAWKSGTSPAVIMDIYNHSSLAVTKRYLGVTQDDKNAVYLGMDFNA